MRHSLSRVARDGGEKNKARMPSFSGFFRADSRLSSRAATTAGVVVVVAGATPLLGAAGDTYTGALESTIAAKNPYLWYHLDEATRTTAVNYGSAGSQALGTAKNSGKANFDGTYVGGRTLATGLTGNG